LVRVFFLLIIVNVFNCATAQNIIYKTIHTGITNSLYDAEIIGKDSLLAIGKNGQILILANENIYTEIKGIHNLYKILIGNNIIQLASDSGFFYFLKGTTHSSACSKNSIYTGLWFQDNMYYASVNKKIASGHKAIPNGTLTSVFLKNTTHYKGSVIWDLQNIHDTLTALKYNIFGTRIMQFVNNKWRKKNHYNALLHSLCNIENNIYYAGTNSFKRKHAVIFTPHKKYIFKNEGVIWDVQILGNYVIASGCKGLFYYKKMNETDFKKLQLPTQNNLYDITILNNNTMYIAGQNGVLFQLKIEE
jgi:hypothetical protein